MKYQDHFIMLLQQEQFLVPGNNVIKTFGPYLGTNLRAYLGA
jgi:hypothetical protein